MKPQVSISISAIAVLVLACSAVTINLGAPTTAPAAITALPTSAPATSVPATSLPATDVPPALPPTATLPPTPTLVPTPTLIPTIVPSPTPADPMLTTIDKPVNCRFGPGTEYSVISYLLLGQSARIEGKAGDGNWWYIRPPMDQNLFCWVAGSVTQAAGNLSLVNVVPAPDVFVTTVALKLDPVKITVPGCVFPYTPVTMTGSITTNGPAIVEYHWETSQGNVSSADMIKFTGFGTQEVSDHVHYGAAGTFWVKLVVTSPNSKSVKSEYVVVCGP